MSCCGPSNVTNSSLLTNNNSKIIKFYRDKLVANNGPNMLMDMDLCNLNIPFDQIFRAQIRLPKQASNVSMQYENVLGVAATFVAIKVTYDPKNKITDDNFIEYFFQGQPDPTRSIGKFMILTGTESEPVPPIALNNPSTKYDVLVDVMAATTKVTFQNDVSQIPGSQNIDNMLWTDILSDPTTGNFVIYSKGTPVAYIDLDQIVSIELNGRIILVDDRSAGEYTLMFVDDYNANQANSLLTWAMGNRNNRITLGMQADTTPPVITYTPTFSTTILLDNYATTSGGVNYLITKQDLIALWILSVVDNRDGSITLDDSNIIITPLNSVTPINAITEYGRYSIVIQVDDAARNRALDTFVLNVKNLNAPRIIVQSQYATQISQGLPIGVSNKIWIDDYPFTQINKQNVIDIFLQQVIDTEDGNISLNVNNVIVTIYDSTNVSLNTIAQGGIYNFSFSVSDSDDNSSSQLYSDVNTPLRDQFNNLVSVFSATISADQPPTVTFISSGGVGYTASDTFTFDDNLFFGTSGYAIYTVASANVVDTALTGTLIPFTSSLLGMTPGTYTNVTASSTTGIGTGAKFIVNVTNTDNIASIEVHPSISLYQFNINGIISKNDLYNFLIVSVQDDRTPSVDIVLIQNQIFNQFTSQELVYIDAVGTYTFLTQHQDSDGKIGTASVIVTVV